MDAIQGGGDGVAAVHVDNAMNALDMGQRQYMDTMNAVREEYGAWTQCMDGLVAGRSAWRIARLAAELEANGARIQCLHVDEAE